MSKMKLYLISALVGLLLVVFVVGEAQAQGPEYNNPYNGGYQGYLYDSGYGYQSAYYNAGVAGQYYYDQAYSYVQQETSWGAPTGTYNWISGW